MVKKFLGTTATHGGTSLGNILSVDWNESCDPIDVGFTDEEVEQGKNKVDATIKAQGHPAIDKGDVGALAVTYADGGSKSLANAICMSAQITGDIGGQPETTYTFKKAPAA